MRSALRAPRAMRQSPSNSACACAASAPSAQKLRSSQAGWFTLPMKYSLAMLRPPAHTRSLSAITSLRWLRRFTRPRPGRPSAGMNRRVCTPAAFSSASWLCALFRLPMLSISSRTRTPARARAASAVATAAPTSSSPST